MTAPPPPLIITEIMYDLPAGDEGREWIEVTNAGSDPILLPWAAGAADWRFSDGDSHRVTRSAGDDTLQPGERLILSADPERFLKDYPNYLGDLAKSAFSLLNSSGTLRLSWDGGASWFAERFYDSTMGGAGDGASLEWDGAALVTSREVGGSPGRERPPPPTLPTIPFRTALEIAEVAYNPVGSDDGQEWIEFRNVGSVSLRLEPIGQLKLRVGDRQHSLRNVSGGPTLEPGRRLLLIQDRAIWSARLGELSSAVLEASFSLPNSRTEIGFSFDNGGSWLAVDSYDPAWGGDGDGRTLERDPTGRWRASDSIRGSPGVATVPPAAADPVRIVIAGFLPYPLANDEEWIELANLGETPMDLAGWQLDDGPGGSRPYALPATRSGGTVLAPGGRLVIARAESDVILGDQRDQVILRDSDGTVVETIPYAAPRQGAVWRRENAGRGRWLNYEETVDPISPVPVVRTAGDRAVIIDQTRPTALAIADLPVSEPWHVRLTGRIEKSWAVSALVRDATGTIRIRFQLSRGAKPALSAGDTVTVAGRLVVESSGEAAVVISDPTTILVWRATESQSQSAGSFSRRSPDNSHPGSVRAANSARAAGRAQPFASRIASVSPRSNSTTALVAAMLGGLLSLAAWFWQISNKETVDDQNRNNPP